MVQTRFSLIRNALKMAEKGNPALMIFCLKNLCKWTDKQHLEHSGAVGTSFVFEEKVVAEKLNADKDSNVSGVSEDKKER